MNKIKNLQRIKKNWEWFFQFEDKLYQTNMLHHMGGSMQHCHDLIWLIKMLDKQFKSKDAR